MLNRFGILAMVIAAVLCVGTATAGTLGYTFYGLNSDVTLNGGAAQVVPLTLSVVENTSNLSDGTGIDGSNEYTNITVDVTAPSLGLYDVPTTNDLSLEIGFPTAGSPFANTTVVIYNLSTGDQGFYGVPGLSSWDEISPFVANNLYSYGGDLGLTLSNGDTLVLHSFDFTAPYGYGSFTATAVPLPTSALSGVVLAGLLVVGRIKAARSAS